MLNYKLLDCGDQKKVEIFGDYKLIRPCPQALWKKTKPELWLNPDSEFERTGMEKGSWNGKKLPQNWEIMSSDGLKWKIEPNEFGNLGVFTEHWSYTEELKKILSPEGKTLNLFTYSGSNCVSLVKAGFQITAVDSSKNAMDTFSYNLEINNLSREGQRIILEDAYKFMAREQRRDAKYSSIMIDAPSYGRGTKGEVFKIEDDLIKLLESSKQILTPDGKIILTLHSPRFTPANLRILCGQIFPDKKVESAEILVNCESGIELPSGFLVKIL